MSNIIAKKYYLELSVNDNKPYSNKDLYCKANDSIQFHITIKENDNIKDLSGCKVSMVSTRNDCTMIEQVIENPIFEDGVLIIIPKKELTNVVSTLTNEITIFDEDESITVQNFIFNVTKTIQGNKIDEETKDSIDSLIELNKIILTYKKDLEELKAQIDDLKNAATIEFHNHDNKETLDLISDINYNKWEETSNTVGTGSIQNDLTIIESINDIYDKLNEITNDDLS